MGELVHLPRETAARVETAATELQAYLDSTPSGADDSAFRKRYDAAAKDGRVHQGLVTAEIDINTWRLSPALNELLRRETIIQPEFDAGQRILRDCFLGMQEGPKGSNYGGAGGLARAATEDRETRRVHHKTEFIKAWESVDPMHQPAIAWLIGTLGKGVPLQALGAHWAPHLGKQTQSARGGAHLAMALLSLCRHYKIKHPLDVIESLERLTMKMLERPA